MLSISRERNKNPIMKTKMAIESCNCASEMNDRTYVGSQMKYKVTMSTPGFDIDNDNWEIEVCRGKTCRVFRKEDCIHRTKEVVTPSGTTIESNWFLCFDTTEFGPGYYYAIVRVFVPDEDFPDNIRKEVKKILLEPVEAI